MWPGPITFVLTNCPARPLKESWRKTFGERGILNRKDWPVVDLRKLCGQRETRQCLTLLYLQFRRRNKAFKKTECALFL